MDAILRQKGKEDVETGGLAMFSTTKVQSVSSTMKSLPAIGQTDAQRWIKYWMISGSFDACADIVYSQETQDRAL
jgi:hypothetical protein